MIFPTHQDPAKRQISAELGMFFPMPAEGSIKPKKSADRIALSPKSWLPYLLLPRPAKASASSAELARFSG
jgi:hypothetical protein